MQVTYMTDEELKELVANVKNRKIESFADKKNLFLEIYHLDNAIDIIYYLQKQGIVDFSDLIIRLDDNKSSLSMYVLLTSKADFSKNFDNFINLYENTNISKNDAWRDDNKNILENIPTEYIAKMIALKNFNLTEEDIEVIGKEVLKYQKHYLRVKEDLVFAIKDAIIRKATNKNEYKMYKNFAKRFENLADYNSYCREKRTRQIEEEKQKVLEKEQITMARRKLYIRLYNLNDSLQEQVPGKSLIKNLTFKKN